MKNDAKDLRSVTKKYKDMVAAGNKLSIQKRVQQACRKSKSGPNLRSKIFGKGFSGPQAIVRKYSDIIDLNSLDFGKDSGRDVIKQCYFKYGVSGALELGKAVIEIVSHQKGTDASNNFKGEIAETVLHCYLRDLQRKFRPSIATHGLCFESVSGSLTAEIDVAFFTQQRLYLFECKCFTGEKILSGQGTLKGKFSEANVYDQSMGHLALLFDYIQEYLRGSNPGVSPVQLVVFDGGLGECKDIREEKDKQVLQYVSFGTLNSWMQGELSKISGLNPVWDLRGIAEVIREFQKVNEESLNKHIERLSDKKG